MRRAPSIPFGVPVSAGPGGRGRGYLPRIGVWLLVVALCVGWPTPTGRAQPAPRSEHEIKAAWLLNFARFTDWPDSAFSSSNAPLVIAVVGRDPFGPALENTFSNKTVAGRSIVVKRLTADQDLKQCHLLFVPASERRRLRDLPDKLQGAPVLIVGESDDTLDHAGTVQLLLKDDSVRFSVNLNAAKAAQLRINANVLRLAVSVRGRL